MQFPAILQKKINFHDIIAIKNIAHIFNEFLIYTLADIFYIQNDHILLCGCPVSLW